MKRLLNKQLRVLSIFASLILVCSIPAYYYVIDSVWLSELDEHNQITKHKIRSTFEKAPWSDEKLEEVIQLWNILTPDAIISESASRSVSADRMYTIERYNELEGESDRFRGLLSTVEWHNKTYELRIETNVEESSETILIIGIVTIFFFLLMMIGFIVLNRRISRKIWKPFYATIDQLKRFELSSQKTPLFVGTEIIEFAELNRELEKLISSNIEAYQTQKRFVENASHELQTPLAVLKAKIDLLLQSPELTKEQMELVIGLALPLSRMSRLNKNLLLLAKIENHQFEEKTPQNVHKLLDENLVLLEDYIVDKQLKISVFHPAEIVLKANKLLLETLFNNLLINAIKYTDKQGEINITLHENNLVIANSGTTALDTKRLFERFTTSSSETTNSGLGLAIVKEICVQNEWKINYHFQLNQHIFSIHF